MPSRGVYRGLYSVLFDDPDYQQLSAHARLVLLTVRLCRDAGPAAIFEFSTDRLMRQTCLTRREVTTALTELHQADWIDLDASLIWVRNGLRYDPVIRTSNPLHVRAVTHWLAGLPKRPIVLRFCDHYHLPYPFESLSIPTPDGTRNKDKDKDKDKERNLLLDEVDSLSGSLEREPDVTHPIRPQNENRRQQARDILAFLNQQAHKSFRDSPTNLKLIEARLASGMTPANLRGIVARKVRTWSRDPKMAQFLRPATLFSATNAEQYLGERDPDA
jgi:uncharacterized phage protein (TIGR02220 family)